MILDYLKTFYQYLIPQHLISRFVWHIARSRNSAFKNMLIKAFIKQFNVDMSTAVESNPEAYACFNDFFTRALQPDARPIVNGGNDIACPADGTISQLGTINDGRIFQAKGKDFSLIQILGGSPEKATRFINGQFATIYLSPRDYHRVHMPVSGSLREMVYVPGALFSVSATTTRVIPDLFAHNERVIFHFDTDNGPMVLIMVGAINVGSIETVWAGPITPPYGKTTRTWNYDRNNAVTLERGQELGRFNMGSTVIMIFPNNQAQWESNMNADSKVQMGQLFGHLKRP